MHTTLRYRTNHKPQCVEAKSKPTTNNNKPTAPSRQPRTIFLAALGKSHRPLFCFIAVGCGGGFIVFLVATSFPIFSCLYFVDGALVLAKYFHFDSSTFGAASFYFLPSVVLSGGVMNSYHSAIIFLVERWCCLFIFGRALVWPFTLFLADRCVAFNYWPSVDAASSLR